jgi:hypothetical protein
MDFVQLCCSKNVVNKVKKVLHAGLKVKKMADSLEAHVEECRKNCNTPPSLTHQISQIFNLLAVMHVENYHLKNFTSLRDSTVRFFLSKE